jgi:hypothetical protein
MSLGSQEPPKAVELEYCRVHKWTSLWMLIPIFFSHPDSIFLHYQLMLTCVISMAHWHQHHNWGVLHILDRALAASVMMNLLHGNKMAVMVLVFVGLTCFALGLRAHHKSRSASAFVYHLLFRYFFFLACCVAIEHVGKNLFLLYSVLFLVHVRILFRFV